MRLLIYSNRSTVVSQGSLSARPYILTAACHRIALLTILQPAQNHLLARLLNMPTKEHLVKDGVHLVKVEDEV